MRRAGSVSISTLQTASTTSFANSTFAFNMDSEDGRELLGTAGLAEERERKETHAKDMPQALVRRSCWIGIMHVLTFTEVDDF